MDLAAWLEFLSGFIWTTIQLTIISGIGTVVLATLLAFARVSGHRSLEVAARVETDFFRSVPLLALLIFMYFGIGPLITFIGDSSFWLAVVALTLSESSYLTEVYRGALLSIPAQQWDAAASIGMNWRQTVRYVIVPQAITAGVPATVNLLVATIKDSSLASLIAVNELTMGATILVSNTFLTMQVYLVVALIYFVLVVPIAYLADYSEGFIAKRIGLAPITDVLPGTVEATVGSE